jgi:hypothetical protein
MRSIAIAALLGLSHAMPALVERNPVWVTVTVYVDAYTTVTAEPSPFGRAWEFRGSGHRGKPPAQSTAVPNPEPEPEPTTSPVPAPESQAPAPSAPAAEPSTPPAETPTPSPAQPSAAPSAAPPASPPASGSYSDLVVYNHNVHRTNHSAPAMAWNQSLADTALKIAQSCIYAHNT